MILDMPPAIYDHAYNGPVIEHRLTVIGAQQACGQLSGGRVREIFACSYKAGLSCVIIIPELNDERTDLFRRHEIAHCNGWSGKHEDGRKIEIKSPYI